METNQNDMNDSRKDSENRSNGIKLSRETKKSLIQWIRTANKKEFGRRVQADDLIYLALSQLTEALVKTLQEKTLSNTDRIEREYREYVKRHGPTKKDVFIGKLLSGEISLNKSAVL